MLPITPVACSTSHSTSVATSIAIAIASDRRNDIFMTDHGSMLATVRRTVRGPFLAFPLIFTPLDVAFTPAVPAGPEPVGPVPVGPPVPGRDCAAAPWSGPEAVGCARVSAPPADSRIPWDAELTRVGAPPPC